MWEAISIMLSIGIFMLIMHYFVEPKKIIEDIRQLKGNDQQIQYLESRVQELEKTVAMLVEKTKS